MHIFLFETYIIHCLGKPNRIILKNQNKEIKNNLNS